jgi:adenosylcobinamide-phosphate synthase
VNATLLIIFMALVLDRWLGEPEWLYSRVPHPVKLMGDAIEKLESWLRKWPNERIAGIALVAVMLACSILLGRFLAQWWPVELVLIAALLAQKSLLDHVSAVARGLETSLADGRAEVAMIVGRNPESLDEAGVSRAACESLAENLADGVIAPLFWAILFGLPGIMAYKALNTLDSMVGHKNERYAEFGWASARLDDLANWVPARITALLYCGIGHLGFQKPFAESWRITTRCAPGHRSPNAGWPEAALAAVCDFRLAGPRMYGSTRVDDAWMGEGRDDLGPDDIDRGLEISRYVMNAVAIILGIAAVPAL